MSIEESLFNEAITKGELVQFLGGFPSYRITPQAADLPTEYDSAFLPIRTRIKEDPHLQKVVLEAIVTLSHNSEYGWGVLDYVTNLALLKKYQGLDLLSKSFLESVAIGLRENKSNFISLKRWVGKEFDDGVWEMVRVNNRILHEDYGITVLPEEL
jgi:hypothetical protein